jgi:dephospho-CoA kinase
MIIAVCGGIGSGKSAVSKRLNMLGYTVIDADAVNRGLLRDSEYLKKLQNAFPDCFDKDGILNKDELKKRIFTDARSRERLNALAHPEIGARIGRSVREAGGTVFVEIPLLMENKLGDALRFDRIWAVVAPRELRLARICARDGVDRALAEKMLDAQRGEEEAEKRADAVIINNGSLSDLYCQVDMLAEGLSHGGE